MTDPLEQAVREHRAALAAQQTMRAHAEARDTAVRAAVTAGTTQADIARALHVDRARINRIVKGDNK